MPVPIFWLASYVFAVVLVNVGFSYVPLVHTAVGTFAPMALLVGVVFVLRDYAQRTTGHWVLAAMALGVVISYLLADPYVAMASAAAFACSEVMDWLIYTVTKKPFHQRVLLSSLVGTPVDTAVFLLGIGHFGWGTFVIMIASKMIAALIVWWMGRDADPKHDSYEAMLEEDTYSDAAYRGRRLY